jgi:hypothetical protein
MRIWITMILLFSLLSETTAAQPTQFSSGKQQVQVIELFTSEGCSSCPPAEDWLNQFTTSPRLWKEIIPVAFHVDYWNYLGWPDKFSNERNTQRQYGYKRTGNIGSVYTPGFVINGKEWRRWFSNRQLPIPDSMPGELSVTIDQKQLSAHYMPTDRKIPNTLVLNVALLGFDVKSEIKGGENKGKTLLNDFVVLNYSRITSNSQKWTTVLPEVKNPEASGIAVWVSKINNQAPIQATGGWLTVSN